MKIKQAEFITSSTKLDQCPEADKPEYAFIGRSNVGKSSLINMLTGRRKLVKVSGSPGKTITINHFLINDTWFFVDLPGYGYAKVSKKEREFWGKLVSDFILNSKNLELAIHLMDSRHNPSELDIQLNELLIYAEIPYIVLLNKSDIDFINLIFFLSSWPGLMTAIFSKPLGTAQLGTIIANSLFDFNH